MLSFPSKAFISADYYVVSTFVRSYHGNKKYMARRTRNTPRNVFTPIETLHALKRGEKHSVRYTDKFGVRSSKFVPKHKLPAPRWNWDYNLTDENSEVLKMLTKAENDEMTRRLLDNPLSDTDWPRHDWEVGSRRCGAVGIKMGVHPLWMKDGSYVNTTLIQITDCHVIKHFSKEEYNNQSAAVLVGAKNANPFYRNEKYHEFCMEAGVPIKEKCFRFIVSENAALKPGTPLNASHFNVGQYIDCTAQSIGYGFQGAIQRWNFKRGSYAKGNKQARRGTGSLSSKPNDVILKGKKMPGQLGGTYECTRGLKILRINYRYNVLYVKGRMPGHVNQFVKLQDSSCRKYQPKNEEEAMKFCGPFPTSDAVSIKDREYPEEAYDDSVFQLSAAFADTKAS